MSQYHGETRCYGESPELTIAHAELEALMPSFVSSVSPSERLMINFSVAVTMLHELAVSFYLSYSSTPRIVIIISIK